MKYFVRVCERITFPIWRSARDELWMRRLRKMRGIARPMLSIFRLSRIQISPEMRYPIGKVILSQTLSAYAIIVAFVLTVSSTWAEEPVILKAQVDKALIKASESVIFTVQLSLAKPLGEKQAGQFSVPEIGDGIAGFRIVDFGQTPAKLEPDKLEGDRYVASRWYKLQADIAGSYVLPSLEIKYKDQTGTEKGAKTPEIFVEVQGLESTTADGKPETQSGTKVGTKKEDIRDIKDIIPTKPLPWLWILLSLSIIGGLGFLIYYYFSKKNKNTFAPKKLPHELALESLELLKGKKYLESRLIKKFHFELSEIARFYLEGRFSIAASDLTTEELQREFRYFKQLDDKQKELFLTLLKTMDIVKFTDKAITNEESSELWEKTKTFVLQTKPVEIALTPTITSQNSNEGDSFL